MRRNGFSRCLVSLSPFLAVFLPRSGSSEPDRRWNSAQARIAQSVLVVALLAVVSALLSPRRAAALDSLRRCLSTRCSCLLGASAVLEGRRARLPLLGL
jgi:hypothetical protein